MVLNVDQRRLCLRILHKEVHLVFKQPGTCYSYEIVLYCIIYITTNFV